MARQQIATKRQCTILPNLFIILLIVTVNGGTVEQCPKDTECMCQSLRMVNPTVVVRCQQGLVEEFPTMRQKVMVFFAFQTRATALSLRSFRNATGLAMISVVDNPISSIEDGVLSSLPNLDFLELANVKLKGTSDLNGLRALTKLTLSDNLLRNFTTSSLLDVPQLDVLELDGNFITTFRFSHDKLRVLNLSRNNLQDFHEESFKNLRMLDTLDLSRNSIVHLRNIASQSLHSLFLAYNQIVDIDGTMWQELPVLKSIDLSNNRIRDLSNVSGLPFLKNLNASGNLIESFDSIHTSATLVNLNLSHNKMKNLSNMPDFPLLESLCMAKNAIEYFDGNALQNSPLLSFLSLEGNRLTEFGSLSNNPRLVSLYLQNNKIEDIEEGAFTRSASLEDIDVGSNKLSDLQAFKNMPSLVYLNASGNMIMEISGQSLQGCTKLSILDLSENLLEEFPNFPVVYWSFQLYLDSNPIRVFDWNKLQNLYSLRRLSLNGTRITYIPPNSHFFPTTHISIENYNASVTIADNALTTLVSLRDLSVLNVAEVSPRIFRSAHNLKRLELRSGELSEITTEWQFLSLDYVDLSQNRIQRIDIDGRSMTRLKSMILTNNLITNVSFVDYLPNLRELVLRHNRIWHIPKDAFTSCSALTVLDLSYNMIEEVIIGTFDYLRALKELYVSYNMLTDFSLAFDTDTDSSHEFKSIYEVHLDGNRISKIDSMTFQSCDYSLRRINLAHNPLRLINETTFLRSFGLKALDLSHTDLQSLTAGLFRNVSYQSDLVVSLNNVTCLKDMDSISLTYPKRMVIKRLELRNNNLTRIPSFNSSIVVELDVSHNNLSDDYYRDLSGTEDLKFLDVSVNNIEELDRDFIQTLPLLKHLNVSSNKLQQAQHNLFDSLHNLETIDLTNNKLDGIVLQTTENIKANVRINLTGNPILCDCSLVKYRAHLRQSQGLSGHDVPEGDVTCHYPSRLSGEYVTDVPLEQFQCKPEVNPSKAVVVGVVGDPIRLECPLRDRNGVTVTWGNVTEMHSDKQIRVSTDGRLLIEQMTSGDSGNYQCNATNQEGSEILIVHLRVGLNPIINDTTTSSNITSRLEMTVTESLSSDIKFSPETFEGPSDLPGGHPEARQETVNDESSPGFSRRSLAVSMELSMFCVMFNAAMMVTTL